MRYKLQQISDKGRQNKEIISFKIERERTKFDK